MLRRAGWWNFLDTYMPQGMPATVFAGNLRIMDAMRSIAVACLLLLGSAFDTQRALATVSSTLPELGDGGGGVVSLEAEEQIGKQLLRQVYAQVPTVHDPILKYYTEVQLYDLAQHSELKRKQLFPVLINSQEVNAFAAPGGVVGINLGLYLTAQTLDEYSAVLAHELAHLSQRHFARQIQAQQQSAWTYLAAMLASIAIAATSGGNAGMAAIATTQGLAEQNQLRFSRAREAEADRIGINTLVNAGLNPYAMADMFEQMQRAYRFSRRPPEFLLTHPVTEARIADARNQAAGYPAHPYPDSPEYQMMRARAMVYYAPNPAVAVQQFKDQIERTGGADWAYYGLVLALSKAGKHEEALDTAKPLLAKHARSLLWAASEAELLIDAGRYRDAMDILSFQLVLNPENKPLSMYYADALNGADRHKDAEDVLQKLSVKYPDDPDVWYQLAETAGLAGDIVEVHVARAEYFARIGNLQQSIQHLEYARGLVSPTNYRMTAMLDQRIRDLSAELAQMRKS
jgi:predicted Zn-dependent protease